MPFIHVKFPALNFLCGVALIFPLAIVFSFPTIKIIPDATEKSLPNKQ